MSIHFQKDVPLSDHTTIGLGGPARLFCECRNSEELLSALHYARDHHLPFVVLGGGSNTIFSENGFRGIVIKIALKGLKFENRGDRVEITAAAGEVWDEVVAQSVENGLVGLEALSGIPGLVGAVPVQNVGAYGREVCEFITKIQAIDTLNFQTVTFTAKECFFGYRRSRFKYEDRGRYIIINITFSLKADGPPQIRYPELADFIQKKYPSSSLTEGRHALRMIRNATIELRKTKSMVYDPKDPDSHSCGSFFLNPVITEDEYHMFQSRCKKYGVIVAPGFTVNDGYKVPAAWLVEQSGFKKGFQAPNGAGISNKHTLAIINSGKSATAVIELARQIQKTVKDKFGVDLELEPVFVPNPELPPDAVI